MERTVFRGRLAALDTSTQAVRHSIVTPLILRQIKCVINNVSDGVVQDRADPGDKSNVLYSILAIGGYSN